MAAVLVRAYATLAVKSLDEEQRIIEGLASTPATDRMGDIVEPTGASFKLPLPLLWQHDAKQPIGQVTAARVTDAGIVIKAQIAKNVLPQIDDAWALIKAGLVRALSIGFTPLEVADIKGTFGQRFVKWEWLELSAVTIPANAEATIAFIKSCDEETAAPGRRLLARSTTQPGATGMSTVVSRTTHRLTMPKTIADQIKDLVETKRQKKDELEAIHNKAVDEHRVKDGDEKDRFDALMADVKQLDAEIADARAMEAMNAAEAKAVVSAAGTNEIVASQSRDVRTSVVTVSKTLDPGIGFTRYVACKAAAAIAIRNGNFVTPLEVAKARYPSDTALVQIFQRTAVGGGTTYGSHYYDDLVPYQILQSDFIEFLRPKTIVGQFGQNGVPSLRHVPFNIRVGGFASGTTGYWKGEGKPIPLSKASSKSLTLTWATVAGLTVISKELVEHSTPSAEAALRNDLAAAIIARMDIDFIDPAKAAVANTSPASITHGITPITPSGTTEASLRADVATVLAHFATNNLGRSNLVAIMSDTMAGNIAMMVNALGVLVFADMAYTNAVPRLLGIPVITSEHLAALGSPSTQSIIFVKADEVYLADDGNVGVDASMEASIEMSDAPTQDANTGSGASLVSMWQTGDVALRAMREVNWALRRPTAVQYISPAAYTT